MKKSITGLGLLLFNCMLFSMNSKSLQSHKNQKSSTPPQLVILSTVASLTLPPFNRSHHEILTSAKTAQEILCAAYLLMVLKNQN